MKARVERNWMNHSVKIWLYHQGPPIRLVRVLGPDTFQDEILVEGAELPEPSLQLPEEALSALIAAVSEILPASDATTGHLKDAVMVRDRLLSLVERSVGKP